MTERDDDLIQPVAPQERCSHNTSSTPEQNAQAVLSVTGLTKRYGKTRAVDDVDLDIRPGEFVVLLGPNGAGKTTLFQILTGLFVADAGHAMVMGHDIRRQAVWALSSVGVVFQQPTIDLDMTVVRNLRFHARLHGLSHTVSERRIDEMLALVGLEKHARQCARTLSGGNRRRVELARALLHEPALLLMDEPTVGLDPDSRRDLTARVRELCRQRGLAVLWATHLVDEAEVADRVVVMQNGKVIAAAHPERLVDEASAVTLADAFHSLTGREAVMRGTTA